VLRPFARFVVSSWTWSGKRLLLDVSKRSFRLTEAETVLRSVERFKREGSIVRGCCSVVVWSSVFASASSCFCISCRLGMGRVVTTWVMLMEKNFSSR
jgi:hypothetical protein